MTENIKHLLTLVDVEFPKRKRIEYDNDADRAFCNQIIKALICASNDLRDPSNYQVTREEFEAAKRELRGKLPPDIRPLAIEAAQKLTPLLVQQKRFAEIILEVFESAGRAPLGCFRCSDEITPVYCLNCAEKLLLSTSPGPASASTPSSEAPSAPETAHSSHTPTERPKTDDTSASLGQTPHSVGTPAVDPAKLAAARRAAARHKAPSSKQLRKSRASKGGGALRPTPPATPETGTV